MAQSQTYLKSRPRDPDLVREIIKSLNDFLIKYLNLDTLIEEILCCVKDEEIQLNSLSSVHELLNWVLDDDTTSDLAVGLFITALENLKGKGQQVFNSTFDLRKYADDFIHLINGSLFESLSLGHLNTILEVMWKEKIIFERNYMTCKTKNDHREFCIQMLKSVRTGKSEWPFMFIDAINTSQALISNIDLEKKENLNTCNKQTGPRFHSDSNIPKCPSFISGLRSVSSSSGLSDSDDFEANLAECKMFLTKEDKASIMLRYLFEVGSITQEDITDEPTQEENCQRDFQIRHSFSDCDSSDEQSDEEKMDIDKTDETPSLNLRNYQLELAEKALTGENTIIWAPTGSGKTRVAVHILLNHLQTFDGSKKRKVAFFAKTVPLVNQQYRCLVKYLPKIYKVTCLTGDSENSTNLHNILPENDIVVLTPRILENHLKKKCVSLEEFSMLVFDECHHTRSGEPFNCLMLEYIKIKVIDGCDKLPQVIGLTASISIENATEDEQAVKNILKICGNLDALSISAVEKHTKELKELVPIPEEMMFELKDRGQADQDKCIWKILEIISELEKVTDEYAQKTQCKWLLQHTKEVPPLKNSQLYGQWAVKLMNKAKTLPWGRNDERTLAARELNIIADFLIRYNTALEIHKLVQLRDVIKYLDNRFQKYKINEKQTSIESKCLKLYQDLKDSLSKQPDAENPNLTSLKEALKVCMYRPSQTVQDDDGKKKSCGIIFVRTRALASALVSWLNRSDDQKIRCLKAEIFTGTSAPPDQGGMSQMAQDNVIQKFKDGEVRLLVSTSVGEEGLDIPKCNVVIKYNHIGNEVSTIQTRGRSRQKGGVSILLAEKNIIEKEGTNLKKAKMMVFAINEIRQMKSSEISKLNDTHQSKVIKDEEEKEKKRNAYKLKLEEKNFTMICQLCGKLIINSQDIRTISGAHRVVVNRVIWKQVKVCPNRRVENHGQIKKIGSVHCLSDPEDGTYCFNKLGSIMVYRGTYFLALGIENFGFDTASRNGLAYYNQWKKVPFFIKEIEDDDFKRYIPSEKELISETLKYRDDMDLEEKNNDESGDMNWEI